MATARDRELDFLLAEYPPLRDEVNRTIDRMTTNETVCAGLVLSIIALQWAVDWSSASIPERISFLLAAVLALGVAFLGEARSRVFRGHMDKVDAYLKQVEQKFGSEFGWSNYYTRTMSDRDRRMFGTRHTLWHALKFASVLNALFQTYLAVVSSWV